MILTPNPKPQATGSRPQALDPKLQAPGSRPQGPGQKPKAESRKQKASSPRRHAPHPRPQAPSSRPKAIRWLCLPGDSWWRVAPDLDVEEGLSALVGLLVLQVAHALRHLQLLQGWNDRLAIDIYTIDSPGNTKGGKYRWTVDLLFDWFWISCVTTDSFCLLFSKQTNPNQSNKKSTVQ